MVNPTSASTSGENAARAIIFGTPPVSFPRPQLIQQGVGLVILRTRNVRLAIHGRRTPRVSTNFFRELVLVDSPVLTAGSIPGSRLAPTSGSMFAIVVSVLWAMLIAYAAVWLIVEYRRCRFEKSALQWIRDHQPASLNPAETGPVGER